MAYKKQGWENGEDGGTPLSAERLNHMEKGIKEKAERGPKGEQGPKGEPGEDGKQGPAGDDGVGVENITRDGNTLVFEMTDGSNIEVDLPSDSGGSGS